MMTRLKRSIVIVTVFCALIGAVSFTPSLSSAAQADDSDTDKKAPALERQELQKSTAPAMTPQISPAARDLQLRVVANPAPPEDRPGASQAKRVRLTLRTVDDFLLYAATAPVSEKERVRAAIARRAGDERIGAAIQERYRKIVEDDYDFALVALSVLGELRAKNSIPFFAGILDERVSANDRDFEHGLSRGDALNMLQAKAVEGLAYLKDPEADEIVLKTAAEHPSRHVRSAAVQAMLYNADDKAEARRKLEGVLSDEDRSLLDLVRRTGARQTGDFNARLAEIYKKYPDEMAAAPGEPTERTDAEYKDDSDPKNEAVTPQRGADR